MATILKYISVFYGTTFILPTREGIFTMSGNEPNMAEQLAENQQQTSVADFFSKNKHMLGFDNPGKSLVTTIKEAVDNSLDAAEEARILPDIDVRVEKGDEYYTVTVTDNGPGVTKEEVPRVFGRLLYGSRFHRRVMKRGQQGIGISASVLNGQETTGYPSTIRSKPNGEDKAYEIDLLIDVENNVGDIREERNVDWDRPHGTQVEITLDANMRARSKLRDYIKYTAVVNPHAEITYKDPNMDSVVTYERVSDTLPAETQEINPHPHGVTLKEVMDMATDSSSYTVDGFLQNDFVSVGPTTADKILDAYLDNRYGREVAYNNSELVDNINEVVGKRKPDNTARVVAGAVGERLSEGTRYTRYDIVGIVEEAVEEAADELDTSLGDTFTEKVADAVIETVWEPSDVVDEEIPDLSVFADDRDHAQSLVRGMSDVSIQAPPTDCLSPIGEDEFERGIRGVFDSADFYSASTRSPDSHGGDPFVAEAAIAYGGKISEETDGESEILRFANRVPLVYQRGACATTDVLRRIRWNSYKLSQAGGSGLPNEPIVIAVHVASTNVPFTSESKDAIANVEAIEDEVELAVRECARELKSHLTEQKKLRERRERRNTMGDILPAIGKKLSNTLGKPEPDIGASMAEIMGNLYVGTAGETTGMRNYYHKSRAFRAAFAFNESFDEDDVEIDGEEYINKIHVGDRRTKAIKEGVDGRRVTGRPSTFIVCDVDIPEGEQVVFNLPDDASNSTVVGFKGTDVEDETVTIQGWN